MKAASRSSLGSRSEPPSVRESGVVTARAGLSLPLRFAERRLFLLLGDVLALCVAGLLAVVVWAWLRPSTALSLDFVARQGGWLLGLGAVWLALQAAAGGYDLRVAARPRLVNRRLLVTALGFAGLYLGLFFVFSTPPAVLPDTVPVLGRLRLLRMVPTFFLVFALLAELAWRNVYALLLTGERFQRRALVVGAGWAGTTIAGALRQHGDGCYRVLGFVDDDPAKQEAVVVGAWDGSGPLRVLGDRRALKALIAQHGVSTLVLAITDEVSGELLPLLLDCLELGVEIVPMPVLYEQLTGRVPVEHVGDSWYVSMPIDHPATGALWPAVKRLMDIALASVGLAFVGLLLPPIALAIYLDSGRPIFYAQERVGKGGRVFRVYKFRSMVVDAEDGEAVWAQENDARVTRVGRILRRTHLDEFPQFVNVLKGEMSVVGPRPERPEFVERLAREIPFYRVRHAVKPGATGWALLKQGYGASKRDALLKLQYDLYYIKHQSFSLDVAIVARTVVSMLALRGR